LRDRLSLTQAAPDRALYNHCWWATSWRKNQGGRAYHEVIVGRTAGIGGRPGHVGFGDGAEIRRPMAITVIGGVSVTLFFTLIVIPVAYSLIDRKKFAVAPSVATPAES
jgi:hypothetical protein